MPIKVELTFRDEKWLFIQVNNTKLFCEYIYSQNKRYLLVFRDYTSFIGDYGRHKIEKGQYFLIENNEILCQGVMDRPNDGKVANNGSFIFNDWIIQDMIGKQQNNKPLFSAFYVFNREGQVIIKKKFKQRLKCNALSNSGNYALLQTTNSINSGNRIIFYDLQSGKMLWQRPGYYQWPRTMFILEELKTIELHYDITRYIPVELLTLNWEGNVKQ